MQDTTVQFDPWMEYRAPWEIRLFALYILVLLAFFLIRTAQLIAFLWRARRDQNLSTSLPESRIRLTVGAHLASIRITSLRRAATLTLLFSVAVTAEQAVAILREVSEAKIYGPGFVGASGAEALTVFTIGVVACNILYAGYSFFGGKLSRLKMTTEVRNEMSH